MTHFDDDSPYTYLHEDDTLVCLGWLGNEQPFATGAAPEGFLDRLAWRCVNEMERATRGIHVCELCPPDDADYISILHGGKKHLLGTAEITIDTGSTRYAAPNLILHYTADHGYLPPADVLAAVMDQEQKLTDWSIYIGPYWGE